MTYNVVRKVSRSRSMAHSPFAHRELPNDPGGTLPLFARRAGINMHQASKGYDAAKQVKGRKRTLVVDTLGLILDLWVHPADIQDYDAGKELLATILEYYPRMKKIWADAQFGKNGLPEWAQEAAGVELEIVKRAEGTKGFVVQAKRWIVERTLGWLNGYRCLSKDYEATTQSSETMIYLVMINLMLHRLAPG